MKENENPKKGSGARKLRYGSGLPVFNPNAGGIDVGDTEYSVAISDGTNGFEVRTYRTFTEDLEALVKWLVSEGITTVAIESTGVYWVNLYLQLEEAGIEPYLVNARHTKNVTGRKQDDTDAIWLQKLHSCGLLQKSFQPEERTRVLRTYVRQRKNLVLLSADSVRRMQKALELMNVKLHTVISDLLGKTGMGMVGAILEGERDPEALLFYKDTRIKASDEEIRKSLKGIWREEYLFMLGQAYHGYGFYRQQIAECDRRIEQILLEYAAIVQEGDITEAETVRKKNPGKTGYTLMPRYC